MSSRTAATIRPPQISRGPNTSQPAPEHIPSNINLFLTNLRLLDLHLRSDWPSITPQTFSTKIALQNQKARISSVEWALFRLFEIWNPIETKNKLRPFFPPLEPLQSLNLRAALFRALNDLKKDGILGRDTVLRKTMLDECKGEKLEEVLMIFSAAVLKKVILSEKIPDGVSSLMMKLSTTSYMSAKDQKLLLPLTIAHRGSLVAALQRKQNVATRYAEFSAILRAKQEQIDEQREKAEKELKESSHQELSDAEVEMLKSELRANWLGDPQWLKLLVEGEGTGAADPLLALPFHEISAKVKEGTMKDLKSGATTGLLEDLNARVTEQRLRLHRWKLFRENFLKRDESRQVDMSKQEKKKQNILSLRFSEHTDLVPGKLNGLYTTGNVPHHSSAAVKFDPSSHAAFDYQNMTQKLISELENVGKAKRKAKPIQSARHGHSLSATIALAKETEKQHENPERFGLDADSVDKPLGSGHIPGRGESDVEIGATNLEEPEPSSEQPSVPVKDYSHMSPTAELDDDGANIDTSVEMSNEQSARINNEHDLQRRQSQGARHSIGLSEEDMIAEKIVFSIANAEPSPVKPQRPLAERARMSLRFSNLGFMEEMVKDQPPEINIEDAHQEHIQSSDETDQKLSLADRTRKSMSSASSLQRSDDGNEAITANLLPNNPFETPLKASGKGDASRASTPREELFSAEAEYASVFKSRPKIAVSPTISPIRDGFLPGLEVEAESDENDELEEAWGSSPLVRTARRI
ncbi:hypothetical protein L228DRAFT_258882 [Xylona heveae TC161]|uniref:HAUS augmin-like complex subunit 6 N-terminal domain-containing protein n=1 Tax=Xylona heveae (strain CBS 132557 / TC161) TaxID=1328760 RepID=A0A165IW30_XYLHT|nr:hypothetical protein L228DRAFT_258882 [Xylona heveae TC161]KZF25461.1 hypothetical protein L228DRAFT_258882 [Xylona heveae TC161]